MAEAAKFVSARGRELRAVALRLIKELGAEAGYQTDLVARLPTLALEVRERLLAIVELIEREQGFGWYFAGDEERAQAGPGHSAPTFSAKRFISLSEGLPGRHCEPN